MFAAFFQDNFFNAMFLSFLPEFFLLLFISGLILMAVKRKDSSTPHLTLLLPKFLDLTTYFFIGCAIYWSLYLMYIPFNTITVFCFFNTLKINATLLLIKVIVSLLVAVSLYTAKRHLLLNNLMYYEYPIVVSLAVFGMFISLMANNWIILFVALELQALCFLTLFAWNRKNVKAITASLKFSIVNFIASILLLLAFVEIILTTQSLNMYLSNPFFFLKNLLQYYNQDNLVFDAPFVMWLQQQITVLFKIYYTVDISNIFVNADIFQMIVTNPAIFLAKLLKFINIKVLLFWDFIGFLVILGFAIKLGLVPFGMWLQDLYNGAALPVLTFFGTAPKLVYLTILSSMYINLFAYINNQHFLNIIGFFGVVTIIMGNLAMFSVRNNLLQLLAWSSISNMGLLFFLVAFFPYYSFSLVFMLYYTVGTLLFFVGLQYIMITDQTGNVRPVLYFTDLSIVRYNPQYRVLFLILMFSLLNFFGIPPLMGFWMKLSVYFGIMVSMTQLSVIQWVSVVVLLLITLIGSYNYLRLLYVVLSENHLPKLTMVYLPNTKQDANFLAKVFVTVQFIFFIGYKYFIMHFSFSNLLMLYTVSI